MGARLVCWGLLIYAAWQIGKLTNTEEAHIQLRSGVLGISALIGMIYLALQMPA